MSVICGVGGDGAHLEWSRKGSNESGKAQGDLQPPNPTLPWIWREKHLIRQAAPPWDSCQQHRQENGAPFPMQDASSPKTAVLDRFPPGPQGGDQKRSQRPPFHCQVPRFWENGSGTMDGPILTRLFPLLTFLHVQHGSP